LAQFLARLQTERELARSEASLRQSQKMDAIGLLAGGVAHDFNNLLTIILAYSEMGLTDIEDSHPLHELFAEIHGAGERAAAMTKKLLAVSRQQPTQTVTCSLNQLICEMDKMLQRLLGPQIALKREFRSDVAPVWADVNQLEQVLLNLVVNARDAMPNGGTITVRTRNAVVSPREARQHDVKPGDYVQLAVTDTGCGMDAATQARIFEPFFTTKAAGKGTGMGLATVFGIVRQTGGYLVVESELNQGTTFAVMLPQSRERLATQSITGQMEAAPVGTETILVVEPDDALRSLIRRLLEVRGYTVQEATQIDEGLKRLQARRPGLDLILADLQLAGVEGLVQQVARHPTGPKLLLMSGNTEPEAGWKLDARQFLRKPFTSLGLARQIRQALEAVR
jgi:nitrogen-specific signal transduction histidine kinase/CheY-like chemotaxis protein